MSIFNDNIVLNIVVDVILLLTNMFIVIGIATDKYVKVKKSYTLFLMVTVYFELYLFSDLINYIVFLPGVCNIEFIRRIVLAIYRFIGVMILIPYMLWFIEAVKEKHTTSSINIKEMSIIFITVVASAFFIVVLIYPDDILELYNSNFDNPINLTYNLAYYVLSFAILCYIFGHYKYLETIEKILFPLAMILPNLFALNPWWSYRPTNFVIFILIVLMYQSLWRNKTNEIALKEKETTEARVDVMVSQIQPHFLYNTLNSIASLCSINPDEARDVTIKFSNYLRGNLNSIKNNKLVEFNKELEHVKNYLDIELVRFKNKLNIEYDIRFSDFKIPPLSLQPIVENAVKHGVCKRSKGGTVFISSFEDIDSYKIIISDNGVGFDINMIDLTDGTHVGISNVINRLKVQCNGNVKINSIINEGTVVTITIPKGGN